MNRIPPCTLLLLALITAPARALPPLHFEDDFSNNSSNWAVWDNPGSGMWFRNGHYHAEIRSDYNQPSRIWNDVGFIDPARDFALETKITYVTGNHQNPNQSYWVQWGASSDANDFYAFGIYPDGRFQYGKLAGGKWIALTGATAAPAVKAGEGSTNVLLVERKKNDLYFSINGTRVHQTKYEAFNPTHKCVAFQGNGRIEFDVDYLRIFQEPAAPGNPYYGLKGLYPKFTSFKKDAKTHGYGYLYAGAVEGNAREGEGVYLTIQKLSGNNGPYLQYWCYKGRFSDNGRKFSGRRYSKWFPLTLQKDDYQGKDGPVNLADFEKDWYNGFSGEFIVLPTVNGYRDLPSFIIQGKGDRDLWAVDQFKWKACAGHYHWGEPAYLVINYDGTRTFTGLVDPNYRPVLGVMDYGNGDKYEGAWLNDQYYGPGRLTKGGQVQEGIWNGNNRLTSAEKVFIPGPELLLKAVSNHGRNLPVDLKLNPFSFADGWDNHFAAGVFDERGGAAGEKFTGPVLIYSDNKHLYFGGLKQGKPDGTGYYRLQRRDDGAYKAGPNVYTGGFENGYFLTGHSLHKTKSGTASADKPATTPVFPGAVELLPATRLIATGKTREGEEQLSALAAQGNSEAGYWLGKLYMEGVALTKNTAKALALYQASADKDYLPSIIALGLVYGNGTDGVPADRNKAITLLRRGAMIPESAGYSQTSVDYCRGNYFVLKYPFLRFEQAVKFSLADETNPASELGRVLAVEKEKFAAAERQQAEQARAQAKAREEFTVSNNKHGWIKGTYLQNLKTKWIYQVSPNRPLYTGNLVEITIRFEDTKQTDYVYERLDALLNESLYKKVAATKRCDHCQGKGFTSRSYNRTVADYEYTLGKKIVQTTTHRDACGNCGGCGLTPR